MSPIVSIKKKQISNLGVLKLRLRSCGCNFFMFIAKITGVFAIFYETQKRFQQAISHFRNSKIAIGF